MLPRFYEFGGKPFDIGYQHGEALKHLIQDFYHDVIKKISKKRSASADTMERRACLEASKYIPYLAQAAPHLLTEAEGLSRGSGLSLEQVFVINCDREFEVQGDECTGFVANEFATSNGETIMAQNRDREQHDFDHSVVIKIVPERGPSMVMSILAGHLGSIGINSAGVAMGHNFLASNDWRPGIPRGVMPRLILEQTCISGVIDLMARTKRASSRNFGIAAASGEACHIETTPTTFRVVWAEPERGYVAHSNHYLHPDLVHLNEECLTTPGNTTWRWRRMHHLCAKYRGAIDVDRAKAMLADHLEYPLSVCVHPVPGVRDNMSISSIIALPAEKRILITWGNPCCSEWQEYRL